MEVSSYNLVLACLTVGVLTLTIWAIVVTLNRLAFLSLLSERILAAITITVLLINAEVYFFSAIPTTRPLTLLPLLHSFGLLALIIWTLRHGGLRSWVDSLKHLRSSVHRALMKSGKTVTLLMIFVMGLMLYYVIHGAYTVTWDWDAIDYHVPMAIQPYQDGRIGNVGSNLPWTDSYPRGTELIWYWTLQWTHSDLLLNPTQLAFGLQLLLATYVLARRSGAKQWAALSACAVIGSTPLMSILTTTGNVDIGYAAAVVTMIALLAPSHGVNRLPSGSWIAASLAYGQACLIKTPVLATLFAVILGVYWAICHADLRSLLKWSWKPAIAAGIVLLCCHSYITNTVRYANPFYPLAISLGDRPVLSGSLNASLLGQTAFSLMGDVSKMKSVQRYYAAWADIFQPLNLQSFGSPGLVFITVVLFGFLLFTFHAFLRREWWSLTLVLMFVIGFLIPGNFLPRYSLPMLAIAVLGALLTFQRLPSDMVSPFRILVVSMCMVGCIPGIQSLHSIVTWIKNSNGGKLLVSRRNLITLERAQLGIAGTFPTPETIQFLRDHSGPGDVLAWNVRAFQGMLWNRTYSNKLVFLPGTPNDSYPSESYGRSNLNAAEHARWLAAVRQLQPRHILVYLHSPYTKYLQSDLNKDYRVARQDTDNGGTGAMIIFERVHLNEQPAS